MERKNGARPMQVAGLEPRAEGTVRHKKNESTVRFGSGIIAYSSLGSFSSGHFVTTGLRRQRSA